jgi:hypothetical protein
LAGRTEFPVSLEETVGLTVAFSLSLREVVGVRGN